MCPKRTISLMGWAITIGIRVTPHVFLNDGGVNLNEYAESLREVCESAKHEKDAGYIR